MTAQYTAVRFQIPSDSFDNVPGALLNFYEAGTLTRVTVYADADLSTELSNPVEADGFGLFPSIFLVPDDYKIVATDEDEVELWTNDDYTVEDIPVLDPNYFSLIDGEYVPGIAVNNQTGTGYTVLNSDRASLITLNNSSGGTVTVPPPSGDDFPNKWFVYLSNIGSGSFTVASSANINGASTFTLNSGSFTLLTSNGSTYFAGASASSDQIFAKTGGTLTIATGAVTIGGFSQYLIDTEGAASSDDLDTISGVANGKLLFLRTASDSHDVVLKHNTGNIYIPSLQDVTLGKTQDIAFLRYDTALSKWIMIAFQNASTKLPVFTASFTSTDITLSSGDQQYTAQNHSLGGNPKIATCYIRCTSTDKGFAADDCVYYTNSFDSVNNKTLRLITNATQVQLIQAQGINMENKDGTSYGAIDYTKWVGVITAYA